MYRDGKVMDDFEKVDKMLDNIIKTMPEKRVELFENVGGLISNQVKENIDNRVNDENNHIKNDVEIVMGSKGGYVAVKPSYEDTNIAHLIENGHRIVRNGIVLGFVNGKHIYRDSVEQCEEKIINMGKDMISEVIKDD